MLPHGRQTKYPELDENHLLSVTRDVLFCWCRWPRVELAEVGLHRQPVEHWELLLGVDVLLVTLLVYNRPVQSSVLLAECLQRLSSRLLYYAALWARLTTTTGRKRSAHTGRLVSLLEPSYNSYEPNNNIGKFPGIPDTGEEEEKSVKRYLWQ